MTGGADRCADAARARADPVLGTAPPTARWLLIEHPGPWKIDAVAGSGLDREVLATLQTTAGADSARILLIRRPGRQPVEPSRSWCVVSPDRDPTWGRWGRDRDLLNAAAALRDPGRQVPTTGDPLLLVCAHGMHDTCCALRGRPVAAALATEWPEATWECSHVGGDRFAANLVVLPDGVYYGNLDAVSAPQVVRAHLAGEVSLPHLRGFTRAHPPAQAAMAAVHGLLGPLGAGEVEVLGTHRTAPQHWQIRLALRRAPAQTYEADVVAERGFPAHLTCRAVIETTAMTYRVVDLRSSKESGP